MHSYYFDKNSSVCNSVKKNMDLFQGIPVLQNLTLASLGQHAQLAQQVCDSRDFLLIAKVNNKFPK